MDVHETEDALGRGCEVICYDDVDYGERYKLVLGGVCYFNLESMAWEECKVGLLEGSYEIY